MVQSHFWSWLTLKPFLEILSKIFRKWKKKFKRKETLFLFFPNQLFSLSPSLFFSAFIWPSIFKLGSHVRHNMSDFEVRCYFKFDTRLATTTKHHNAFKLENILLDSKTRFKFISTFHFAIFVKKVLIKLSILIKFLLSL